MDKQIEAASKDFAADLNALRDDITKLTASVAELVRAQASTASAGVMGVVDSARQKAADTAATAQDKVGAVASELETAVEKNPVMALMIAVGAGLIMGLLSRPRH
jgi:ElaB/YqjD/DUF883 family membrane-anchored ribosome-binding protein